MFLLHLFAVLMLLLTSPTAPAFTSPDASNDLQEKGLSVEISEDIQELLSSTLTNLPHFQPERWINGNKFNFHLTSIYRSGEAKRYIAYSRTIDPGLGLAEILFPYHSFL